MTEEATWINDDPPQEEIFGQPGKEYIPIGITEINLTKLDPFWSDHTFQYRLDMIHCNNVAGLVSGSIEITVKYNKQMRRLVGAATLIIPDDADLANPEGNSNFAATVKSECIKNAVKAIGKRFGAGLNDRDIISIRDVEMPRTSRKRSDPVEMQPTAKEQDDFNKAAEAGLHGSKKVAALKAIYPSIKYTGTNLPYASGKAEQMTVSTHKTKSNAKT